MFVDVIDVVDVAAAVVVLLLVVAEDSVRGPFCI